MTTIHGSAEEPSPVGMPDAPSPHRHGAPSWLGHSLTVALRDSEPLRSAVRAALPDVELADGSAFARNIERMTDHAAFEVCEVPVGTVLAGAAAGASWVVLPVVCARRRQQDGLGVPRETEQRPLAEFLAGGVAVQSYLQTTGIWIRWILAETGVDLSAVPWRTVGPERFPVNRGPAPVRPLEPGTDLVAWARMHGRPIVAPQIPDDFRPLLSDASDRALDWYRERRIGPISHVLVASRRAWAERRDAVVSLVRGLRAHVLADQPLGWAASDRATASLPSAECFDHALISRTVEALAVQATEQGALPTAPDAASLVVAID